MNSIVIRPLTATDFGMLHIWMNAPHLRPFYMQEEISAEEVNSKFTPRIVSENKVTCLIAEYENQPFGYLQWYYNRSFRNYGVAHAGYWEGVSFDYFIGDPQFLGNNLGCKMLDAAIEYVSDGIAKSDQRFFLIHDNENQPAIKCSKNAGFECIEAILYNNKESGIYRRTL